MLSSLTSSSKTSSSKTLGLAVVGCGKIMPRHLRAIAETKNSIVLRAVCDIDAERRQDISEHPAACHLMQCAPEEKSTESKEEQAKDSPHSHDHLPQFTILGELLADTNLMGTIDIIFIAVPHGAHEPLALQVLNSCHDKVLVMEKPMGISRVSLNNLVEASQEAWENNKMMTIITEQSAYFEEVVEAKKLIQENAIGTVITAASYYYQTAQGSFDITEGIGWRGSVARAGGGITIDGGVHWIRPLRDMLGRIEEVFAITRVGLQPELQMEGETLSHALLKIAPCDSEGPLMQPTGSGQLVATYSSNMLATAPMAYDSCPYFRISGTHGELVIHGDGGLRLYNEQHAKGKDIIAKPHKDWFYRGFVGLWHDIYRMCVDKDHQAAHDNVIREADDVRVALAVYESAKSGQWEQT